MAGDGEWEPRKAAENFKKARRRLCGRSHVLHDERAITVPDDEGDEERYVTIGMDALGNVLVVSTPGAANGPRLISARKATPQDREPYGIKP